MKYRARFAPSPSGLLHIGNARSAVLNWAHIKNKGGEFILRIDDTDKERSNKQFENKIKENLLWLGINWIKTFNQSERKNIYDKKILILKKLKKLYPCFESAEELSLKIKTRKRRKVNQLEWNTIERSGIKGYIVFRGPSERVVKPLSGILRSQFSFTDKVDKGAEYFYQVRAYTTSGQVIASDIIESSIN